MLGLRIYRLVGIRLALSVMGFTTFSVPQLSAQRHSVVTSVRHSNTEKAVDKLDWVGLFDQLEPYRRWWKETADCISIPLPESRLDSVQFYFVNAPDFVPAPTDKPTRVVVGVTYAASEQIYLSATRLRDERTVKHEMMHQILFWWGERDWDNDGRPEFKQCNLDKVA